MILQGRVVSDTGPLISLEKLSDGWTFIRRLHREIVIPPTVLRELAEGQFTPPRKYLEHYGISDFVRIALPSSFVHLPEESRLHTAEIDAICLAKELDLPLLIEETIGRRAALDVGLPISGIAGEVMRAWRLELLKVDEARRMVDQLFYAGRINRKILETLRGRLETSSV